MADNGSHKMGKREMARRQKRRRRRIAILICVAVVIVILLCVLFASYYGSHRSSSEEEIVVETESVEESSEEEDSELTEEEEEETEEPDTDEDEELEEEEDSDSEAADEEEEADSSDTDDSSSSESSDSSGSTASVTASSSTSTSTSSSTLSATVVSSSSESTGSSSSGSSSESASNASSSTGSSTDSGSGTDTEADSETEILQSATLTSEVDSVTVGASGTLACEVTSSSNSDITAECRIVYYGTGCTISGDQVYFDTVGTAQIYAVITYNGSSIRTNTITITVVPAELESVSLECSVSSADYGDTAELTVKALDENGSDVTSDCTITWKTENCAVEDGTVTFDTAGTAEIYAIVTYEGSSMQTNTITVEVTLVELESVALECAVDSALQWDTAELVLTALNAEGEDITEDCTVVWETQNCTVEDGTVTFDTIGTAEFYAEVTYADKTLTSDTITIEVEEDPQTLTSVTLICSVEEVEREDTAVLSALAEDQDGNELDDVTFVYEGTDCTIDGDTVTFDEGGTATLKVSATRKHVTVSSEEIEVTVHHTVTLSDGTETDLTDLSQEVESELYGWSVQLPDLFEEDESSTESSEVYSSGEMGFTVTFSSSARSSGDTDSVYVLYKARLQELEDLIEEIEEENETLPSDMQGTVPEILSSSYSRSAGTYTITWQQGSVVYTEQYYVGESRIESVVASWDEDDFPEGEYLIDYILDTYESGDLD